MLKNKFLSFIILAIATYSASFIGGIATYAYKEPWYSTLTKPSFNPPDWVFGPIWTILYLFMTIAIWSAWHKNTKNLDIIYLYFIHLFFKCPSTALIEFIVPKKFTLNTFSICSTSISFSSFGLQVPVEKKQISKSP